MVSVIYYIYKSDIAQISICEKYYGKKKRDTKNAKGTMNFIIKKNTNVITNYIYKIKVIYP